MLDKMWIEDEHAVFFIAKMVEDKWHVHNSISRARGPKSERTLITRGRCAGLPRAETQIVLTKYGHKTFYMWKAIEGKNKGKWYVRCM